MSQGLTSSLEASLIFSIWKANPRRKAPKSNPSAAAKWRRRPLRAGTGKTKFGALARRIAVEVPSRRTLPLMRPETPRPGSRCSSRPSTRSLRRWSVGRCTHHLFSKSRGTVADSETDAGGSDRGCVVWPRRRNETEEDSSCHGQRGAPPRGCGACGALDFNGEPPHCRRPCAWLQI